MVLDRQRLDRVLLVGVIKSKDSAEVTDSNESVTVFVNERPMLSDHGEDMLSISNRFVDLMIVLMFFFYIYLIFTFDLGRSLWKV